MRLLQWNVLNRPAGSLWTDGKTPMLVSIILEQEPGAITLQEVPVDALDGLDAKLRQHGWSMLAGEPAQDRRDVSVAAWDGEAFRCVDSVTYETTNIDAVTVCLSTVQDGRALSGSPAFSLTSYHGYWGAFKQAERLAELRELDATIGKLDASTGFLCGDFNAVREEDAVRWLAGEKIAGDVDFHSSDVSCHVTTSGMTTFWNEAQDVAVALGRQDSQLPTTLNAGAAEETAAPHGIDVKYMPRRRIDFMFSHGWTYGKLGGWTGEVALEDHPDMSDHSLMTAETID